MTAIEEEVEYLWQKIPFNVKMYLFTFIFLTLIKDGCQKRTIQKPYVWQHLNNLLVRK